jgi:hypothetical protein
MQTGSASVAFPKVLGTASTTGVPTLTTLGVTQILCKRRPQVSHPVAGSAHRLVEDIIHTDALSGGWVDLDRLTTYGWSCRRLHGRDSAGISSRAGKAGFDVPYLCA